MKTRHFLTGISLAIAMLSISRFTAAQQTGAAKGVPVQIVVSVEPKDGKQIPMITQQSILVYQGHDLRPVTGWVPATGNRAGLALAILIDEGSAFSLSSQLNDIRAFIGEQAPTTLVAVGYMRNGTVSLAQNFTKDHTAAAKSLRPALGYYGAGGSPYLSLSDFIKRWSSDPAIPRREVLMITPGIDTVYWGGYPNPYADAAIHDAQCAGVVVYSIYTPGEGHFGHSYWRIYWGQNYLSDLSEETGGEAYYFMGPQPPVAFAPYLDKMSHQLKNQFLLTFLAEPQKKAGAEPVEISSEIHSVDFVHADKVCVPASPAQ
ncbi:MAG: hypothetical protein LAN18_12925 [Acidobacteriia bacterium]|nr:hypothetical protein [Terriglobia bacterium]